MSSAGEGAEARELWLVVHLVRSSAGEEEALQRFKELKKAWKGRANVAVPLTVTTLVWMPAGVLRVSLSVIISDTALLDSELSSYRVAETVSDF